MSKGQCKLREETGGRATIELEDIGRYFVSNCSRIQEFNSLNTAKFDQNCRNFKGMPNFGESSLFQKRFIIQTTSWCLTDGAKSGDIQNGWCLTVPLLY